MRKCVKMVVTDYGDIDELYAMLKKRSLFNEVEGVAEPYSDDEVHLTVYGSKDSVDEFVGAVEEIVLKENMQRKHEIGLMVEPFLKEEDYRGVFRFIKKQ